MRVLVTRGSSEFHRELTAEDCRIRYTQQAPSIPTYDDFLFAPAQARGKYFMWVAHHDTRDLDFVSRLRFARESGPASILAFGYLNIVTSEDSLGKLISSPFQTRDMGRLARLAKLSRLQCYYICDWWDTSIIRPVPYAYCVWWSDLPMMLAGSVMGTFVHVPDTRFHYLEQTKSSPDRVKARDYTKKFSYFRSVTGLVLATYQVCSGVGGLSIGISAALLFTLKQAVNAPGLFFGALKAGLVGAES